MWVGWRANGFAFCRKIFVGGVAWETTEGTIYRLYLLDLVRLGFDLSRRFWMLK